MNKLLFVDDDEAVLKINQQYFTYKGYDVKVASSVDKAYEILTKYEPNCVVLDVMMPKESGFLFCKGLREHSKVPVIFLSACIDADERLQGFEEGGDDYMIKPYNMKELEYRVVTTIERHRSQPEAEKNKTEKKVIEYDVITIDEDLNRVWVRDREVILTKKEFKIILLLAKKPEKIFSVNQIFAAVWNMEDNGDLRTVQVHVSNLRKKIEEAAPDLDLIQTAWGSGYRLHRRDLGD